MALTLTINIQGPQPEKDDLLAALNWYVPKTTGVDAEGNSTVLNPIDGMNVEEALKYLAVQTINSALQGYATWQQMQTVPPPPTTVS